MTVSVRLLGEFEVTARDGSACAVSARKARALLAYLCVRAGRPQQREHVALLLWGDVSSDDYARKSLRQALTVLRRDLPEALFEATRDELWVDPDQAQIDVVEFETLAKKSDRAALEKAIGLYRGELLEGFRSRSDAFDDWLSSERLRLRERVVEALGRLLAMQRSEGDSAGATETAIRMVSLDPLREEAHRALMLSYAEQGRLGDALDQYENCRVVLERELGHGPSGETAELLSRLRQGGAHASTPTAAPSAHEAITQLRVVAVLATSSAEVMDDTSQIAEFTEAVAEQGGVILRRTATSIVAAFGARRSQGSEAARAVSAALCIVRAGSGSHACGISYAQAMVTRNDEAVTVAGEAVSQAVDLAALANPGGIVVSESVRLALRDSAVSRSISLTPRSDSNFRRRSWQVEDRPCQPSELLRVPFVGRVRETAILQALLSACQTSSLGQLIVIRGEAGIGKTRLMEHCAWLAERQGYRAYRAAALDFGPQSDRDVVAQLTRALLNQRSADTASTPATSTVDAEPKSTQDRGLLLQLAGLDRATSSEAAERSMLEARAARQRQLWHDLWHEESIRQATLVLIEDLHWADETALEPITNLLDLMQHNPLVVLVSTRPDGTTQSPAWLGALRGHAVTSLDLGPLCPQEGRQLAELLAVTDPARVEAAIERSGGHPLFLEQIFRSNSPAELSESIQATLQTRIDQLAPDEAAALGAAAVLGSHFDLSTLSELIDDDVPAAGLLRSGLIRNPSGKFMFSHALIRDAVYESLPPPKRRSLHARAARIVKHLDLALTAEHLDRAEDAGAAEAYLEAARQADAEERVAAALELTERGLSLAFDTGLGFTLTLLRARLLPRLGRREAAERAAREALAMASTSAQRARAWVSLAESLRGTLRDRDALEALAAAEQAAASDDHATLSHIHYLTGSVLFPRGRARESLEAHERALSHAKLAASADAEARAQSGLGDAYYVRGDLPRAARHFEHCTAIADRLGMVRLARVNRVMSSLVRFFNLDQPQAMLSSMSQLAQSASDELDLSGKVVALSSAMFAVVVCGSPEQQETIALQVVDAARRSGRHRLGVASPAYAVAARVAQGKAIDADRQLDEIYARSAQTDLPFAALNTLGPMLACCSDGQRRSWIFDEADRILETDHYVSHGLYLFCRYALDACLQTRQFDRLAHYANILERYTQPYEVGWGTFYCDWARTLARASQGQLDDGLHSRLTSLAELTRANGMRLEHARVMQALQARASLV